MLKARISQQELEQFEEHDRKAWWYREQAKALGEEIRDLLVAGADVEPGRFELRLVQRRQGMQPWVKVIEHPPLLNEQEGACESL